MSKTGAAHRLGCTVIFILITFAYVTQTELTQAVQRTYRKPFLLLFVTHSGYLCILPLHLLLLRLLQPHVSLRQRLAHLQTLIRLQFHYQQQQQHARAQEDQQPLLSTTHPSALHHCTQLQAFPLAWFVWRSVQLTLFLALPAMCWYGAVPFADMTSITSIFNTNACFTYLFAVLLIRDERFESRNSLAVLGSLLGALMITYGEQSASDPQPSQQNPVAHLRPLGISLALLGSIGYALYEVWYKASVAWSDAYYTADDPQQPTLIRPPRTTPDPSSDLIVEVSSSSSESGTALADPDYLVSSSSSSSPTHLGSHHLTDDDNQDNEGQGFKARLQLLHHPQQSLYSQDSLLHANLMTTMVGVCTLCLLWIPLPFLHWAGIEHFELVHDPAIVSMILGIIFMGVLFNAGFMILLGLWGPVVASVGNLCTLVLIAVIDHTPIGGLNNQQPDWTPQPFGLLSLLGCASILAGFSILNF